MRGGRELGCMGKPYGHDLAEKVGPKGTEIQSLGATNLKPDCRRGQYCEETSQEACPWHWGGRGPLGHSSFWKIYLHNWIPPRVEKRVGFGFRQRKGEKHAEYKGSTSIKILSYNRQEPNG